MKKRSFYWAVIGILVAGCLVIFFSLHPYRALHEDDATLPKLPAGDTPINR